MLATDDEQDRGLLQMRDVPISWALLVHQDDKAP
jgi:hypothetical protein